MRREQPGPGREPDGLPVLALFLVASLIMVGGVWLTGQIDSSWVLVPVATVHLFLTAAVLIAVFRLLGGGSVR